MAQPPAPVSMLQASATTPSESSSNIEGIFDTALKSYKEKTKNDLKKHDLFKQLESCDSPAAILAAMTGLNKWLAPTINVLYAFSGALSEGVALVFPPANLVFAGVGALMLAAKGVTASQDILVDIFGRIESFFVRLENYSEVPLTPAMTDKMVEITVEILDILATATKEMKRSRAKTFLKKVAGWTDLEDGLTKLDKLTNEEVAMASARILEVTHTIDEKVTAIVDGVNGSVKSEVDLAGANVEVIDDMVQRMVKDAKEVKMIVKLMMDQIDDVKENQLRESLRKWQSPPDPSTNHNIIGDRQHEGTAEWFFESDQFESWKVTGSLLWIHGKPGSGKSVLCSAIINNITTLCAAGSASMAYFYFDFRDVDKQARRNLLPSLLIQLSTRSDAFFDILSRLYETYNSGARQPSDEALTECLKEMLTLPNQGPVYLIIDALDECSDTSDILSPREVVLDLVKDLVSLRLPSLHICVTSRLEADICEVLESLASQTVSLQDEHGQRKDITSYVRSVVYSGSGKFKKWRGEDKEHVIETLSERADGMFRWVFCQLETLRNCLPQNVHHILRELPKSLDETYERVLREIGKLAEVLALDFDEAKEGIPVLNLDWRWDDEQEGVLSMCSSLIVVVYDDSSKTHIVQLAHFSVKEFLTSDRLASLTADISRFHIRLDPAHTVIVQACLAILLRPNCGDMADRGSPLSEYAAQHWVVHAQFENHGSSRLTSISKWHAFYLGSDDFNLPPESISSSEAYAPFCLYYAALCGFRDLTKHLVAGYPQHVNATVGYNKSPLAAALRNKHIQVAEILYQHGAFLPVGHRGCTLLHATSRAGLTDVAIWLINIGANVNSQQDDHTTPLHLAAGNGHLGVVQTLLAHNADVNVAKTGDNHTPLHDASKFGHFDCVQLLMQNGADARTDLQRLLFLASSSGNVQTVELFIQLSGDVSARDGGHKTSLHLASSSPSRRSSDVVRALMLNGVDVNARDGSHKTPLHLASSMSSWLNGDVCQTLIMNGADVNARDGSHSTPLHLASKSAFQYDDVVQVLIRNGADVNARDGDYSTPLHLASLWEWKSDVVRTLILNGADVHARDGRYSTPLHVVSMSSSSNDGVVRTLILEGANVNARDGTHKTPLHLASFMSNSGFVRTLIENGADVNARDWRNSTPLHILFHPTAHGPDADSLCLLLENGADVDAVNDMGQTPVQFASSGGHHKMEQLLLKYRVVELD
ncbi:ankyrin repeat-containing domain protein [Lactarius akahatsu]|uniref:Ankyrin repeat-containing domain protein n=1 Tax=Lactarius akahatsu TaxID=416441 RepID=A0AAD4L7T2_9AGAM|nr:ankyrin repeat-containing domain protein [Lactarius akahatsu]